MSFLVRAGSLYPIWGIKEGNFPCAGFLWLHSDGLGCGFLPWLSFCPSELLTTNLWDPSTISYLHYFMKWGGNDVAKTNREEKEENKIKDLVLLFGNPHKALSTQRV